MKSIACFVRIDCINHQLMLGFVSTYAHIEEHSKCRDPNKYSLELQQPKQLSKFLIGLCHSIKLMPGTLTYATPKDIHTGSKHCDYLRVYICWI